MKTAPRIRIVFSLILSALLTITSVLPALATGDYGKDDKYNKYYFVFENGAVYSGQSSENNVSMGSMTVHISCSDDFPGGYSNGKGDPTPPNDPRVTYYRIDKYHRDKQTGEWVRKGGCEGSPYTPPTTPPPTTPPPTTPPPTTPPPTTPPPTTPPPTTPPPTTPPPTTPPPTTPPPTTPPPTTPPPTTPPPTTPPPTTPPPTTPPPVDPDPLQLIALCSVDPANAYRWQLSNDHDIAITVNWSTDAGEKGSFVLPGNTSLIFETDATLDGNQVTLNWEDPFTEDTRTLQVTNEGAICPLIPVTGQQTETACVQTCCTAKISAEEMAALQTAIEANLRAQLRDEFQRASTTQKVLQLAGAGFVGLLLTIGLGLAGLKISGRKIV